MAEDTEEEFHWRYAPLEVKHGGETYYHVCEEYPGMGFTDEQTPMGESMEELITELEMMLQDMKDAHAIGHTLVKGQDYDCWRLKEFEGQETIPWDEVEEELFGDEDTVPMGEPYEDG
jgi:hypothetical protein